MLSGTPGADWLPLNSCGADDICFSGSGCFQDLVNSPAHYADGKVECIDAIESSLTIEAFRGYLKGNIEKYIWRYENKGNPKQDLKKAKWYLNKLISTYDSISFS